MKTQPKLGIIEFFNDYLEMARLNTADKVSAEEKMKLFKKLWNGINFTLKQKTQILEKMLESYVWLKATLKTENRSYKSNTFCRKL